MHEVLDKVLESVNVWRFQWRLHLLNMLVGVVASSHIMLDVMLSVPPPWTCEHFAETCWKVRNKSLTAPCYNGSVVTNIKYGPDAHHYFIYHFKLFCNDHPFGANLPLASSVFFLGSSIGAPCMGVIADYRGRLPTLVGSMTGALITTIVTILSPSIEFYILLRLFDGFFFSGYLISSLLVTIEYTIPEKRYLCVLTFFLLWGPGMLILLLLSFAFASWQVLPAYCSGLTFLALVLVVVFGIESCSWTFTNSLKPDAKKKIIQSIARVIRRDTANLPSKKFHRTGSMYSIKAPFRHKQYRRNLILLALIWLLSALSYYMKYYDAYFKQNKIDDGPNIPFIWRIISSSAWNIIGFTVTPLLLKCSQRRVVLVVVSGLLSLLAFLSLVPNTYVKGITSTLTNILSCAMFSAIYLATLEIIPTTNRGLILGGCVSLSRVGAIVAPQFPLLRSVNNLLPSVTLGVILLTVSAGVWNIIETKDVPNFYEFSQIKDHLLPKKSRQNNSTNIESSTQSTL